jgi:hypothetical protein
MIGPIRKNLSVPRMENLFWLGPRPHSELGRYARAFDLCILPYRDSAEKFLDLSGTAREMLVTGRKVISTIKPGSEHSLFPYIRIRKDPEHFIQACYQAVFQGRRSSRLPARREAARRSWDRVAKEVADALATLDSA